MVWLRARATIMEILLAILVYRDLKYRYVFIHQSISKLLQAIPLSQDIGRETPWKSD